ncbi:hypothetical protein HDU79_011663 [Rhizoclosmatium sp. JEL0117]|nr:hypothetical protein HDU79_011663 [Rhizoclosmatium sp. JEL0117]
MNFHIGNHAWYGGPLPTKTKSNRGRKPTNTEPATKRIAQVRAATAKYKEKKEQYVKGLEDTLQQLKLQQTPEYRVFLQERLAFLESENQALKALAASFTTMDGNNYNFDFNFATDSEVSPPSVVSSETQFDDLFIFDPIPLPSTTFIQSHADASSVSSADSDLEVLLNSPLIEPPTPESVVEMPFYKIKKALYAIPSLANDPKLVDTLYDHYVTFLGFLTQEVNPFFCRFTYGKILIAQGKLIEKCKPSQQDVTTAVSIFDAVKDEFMCDIDEVCAPNPRFKKLEI